MSKKVYVLIDGENIDATLGKILERRPNPEDRPRWHYVLAHARELYPDAEVSGLFFLHSPSDELLPIAFVKALTALGFTVVPLKGTGNINEQVVDIGILRTLTGIFDQGEGHVILVSHDGGYADIVKDLLGNNHDVSIVGFNEFVSSAYVHLQPLGLQIFDLENDVGAFDVELPRVRVIDLEEFDPSSYL
ncbi:NYN domain-containing protein [Stomatohabitans albus]|uniref:NYN domain-containing protein n=1 Tax=Stomatohabitans albus TaxID=3110766 RepID=UPI00300D3A3B